MQEQYKEHMIKWQAAAKDYPTKAILTIAHDLFLQQAEVLMMSQSKLDGKAWSRENWDEDSI
ncbi:hypothetical protein HZY91_06270 [Facklamia sp. DSM 111018]|uniref:Uncharacterized protein n=1 Tax=Facklamia lactis TaxID=2749967 RepID=A0ABS0LR72_9LACT|nr:hypothetical protein [Facklamia lactis]MBG9980685.1 hypothetical protein [Facklamia lactis]MBG9986499.1 hypothetical protein [Facklamia lactis]